MTAGVSHRFKTEAMQRGGADSLQRLDMIACSVAFVASEASVLSGDWSSCATHICSITSSAGASVISFESEVIKGNSATIDATVKEWQQQSVISASGVIAPFNTATNELHDTFSLLKLKGKFIPGQGP